MLPNVGNDEVIATQQAMPWKTTAGIIIAALIVLHTNYLVRK
jgi:hypothetical protein